MDIEIQNYDSPFIGFVDEDDQYSNLFGIRGKKYYAKKEQEQAQATAQAAAAAAAEQKANALKLAQAAKAQEEEAKAILKEQEAKLEQAQAQMKQQQILATPSTGQPMSNKKLLIGGGIALAVIIGLVVVLK